MKYILPFVKAGRKELIGFGILWALLLFLFFELVRSPIIPSPIKIGDSLLRLVSSRELYDNFFNSLILTCKAMIYSGILTMLICYLSTIPVFRPLSVLISKLRYLTITGLVFLFTMIVSNVGELKISLLIFGITPFFVTSFMQTIDSIPQQEIDKAFVNRMNRWEALYEVVIVGRMSNLLETMRQNFAMAWMMITAVEGYAMSEGGIGSMMIKSNKYLNLADVFAMLIIVLLTGMGIDFLLSKLRTLLFPYLKQKT